MWELVEGLPESGDTVMVYLSVERERWEAEKAEEVYRSSMSIPGGGQG